MKAKLGGIATGVITAAALVLVWHPTGSEARDGYPAITPGFTVPAPEPTHSHAPLAPIKSPIARPTDRAPMTRNVGTPAQAPFAGSIPTAQLEKGGKCGD